MAYGILALAILYVSFFFNEVWVHLAITLVIAALYVKPWKLGELMGKSG